MKPKRVYIDTSVVGGCLDTEFCDASLALFWRFRRGEMVAVVSELTLLELKTAPAAVRAVLDVVPPAFREDVLVTQAALDLAARYLAGGVIGAAKRSDAEHIATAAVHTVDMLVSWNFKHIVNPRRIYGYNRINEAAGFAPVEIRTPREVLADGA